MDEVDRLWVVLFFRTSRNCFFQTFKFFNSNRIWMISWFGKYLRRCVQEHVDSTEKPWNLFQRSKDQFVDGSCSALFILCRTDETLHRTFSREHLRQLTLHLVAEKMKFYHWTFHRKLKHVLQHDIDWRSGWWLFAFPFSYCFEQNDLRSSRSTRDSILLWIRLVLRDATDDFSAVILSLMAPSAPVILMENLFGWNEQRMSGREVFELRTRETCVLTSRGSCVRIWLLNWIITKIELIWTGTAHVVWHVDLKVAQKARK